MGEKHKTVPTDSQPPHMRTMHGGRSGGIPLRRVKHDIFNVLARAWGK